MNKIRLSLYALSTLVALIIIFDFVCPGTVINDEIVNVQREHQQYYNAAGNHHYSYTVTTNKHEFLVSEDFTDLERGDGKVEYSVSRIFNEVNWYKLLNASNKSFYSLRIVSGLVVPLLAILVIFITYRFKRNIDILVFVLQVLLIADLIFLII